MKNQKLGYARVSTLDQNLSRQIDMLNQYGVDKLYTEKMSGTKRDRPELAKLLSHMDEGDTIVIESLSRLGRSTKDLIELVELFQLCLGKCQLLLVLHRNIRYVYHNRGEGG